MQEGKGDEGKEGLFVISFKEFVKFQDKGIRVILT